MMNILGLQELENLLSAPQAAQSSDNAATTVSIPRQFAREAKIRAANEGIKMSAWITRAIIAQAIQQEKGSQNG